MKDELTFYGESELKESLLAYTKEHQELDAYRRGSWLFEETVSNGHKKGCFYGCMTQTEDNTLQEASKQYGLPLWYVHLTENIYEGLPENEWLSFPFQAIEILPVGIDMNKIRSLWNYKLLEDQLRFCKSDSKVQSAIKQCMKLFEIPFNKIAESAAESAALSARSAALSALSAESVRSAESAALSAESAAMSARSAALSAESAAMSAESAALSARSAALSARSAALSAESVRSAESAALSAESAALSARSAASSEYYSFQKQLLFDCIRQCEDSKKKDEFLIKVYDNK